MSLKLYNSLTRQLEQFRPLKKGRVGMYTCGPTVYNYAHIGNLRTYVFEDILKRVLIYNGYKVNHVMNITDVGHLTSDADEGEDKIEKGAKRENKSVWEIAEFYTIAFKQDLSDLNIIPPKKWCKATDHVKEQIELIKKLEKKGFIYKTTDGVYFNTVKLSDYGKLARLDKQKLKAGARVGVGEKKNATDFVLWKFSPANTKRQMEWDSPWGRGFPGWHLECSALSKKFLGQPFDIHCGGIDHIPVHHTNEIAQSEAANDKSLANYWLHGEFLLVEADNQCPICNHMQIEYLKDNAHLQSNVRHAKCKGCGHLFHAKKMAKSENNFLTLNSTKEKNVSPLAYRYLLLQTHYRKQLAFSWKALSAAANGLEHLYRSASLLKNDKKINDSETAKQFLAKINNDLDIPNAISLVWETIRKKRIKLSTLLKFDSVLGLKIKENIEKDNATIPAAIKKIMAERALARKNKDWAKSDELRKTLEKMGYKVEDEKNNTILRKI